MAPRAAFELCGLLLAAAVATAQPRGLMEHGMSVWPFGQPAEPHADAEAAPPAGGALSRMPMHLPWQPPRQPPRAPRAYYAQREEESERSDEALKRKCEYLARAKLSPRWSVMSSFPSTQKLERECDGLVEGSADAGKERVETRCAWLKKLLEKNQIAFLKSQPWYHKLEKTCEIVPTEELADNAQQVDEQTCVWLMLFRMFRKTTGIEGPVGNDAQDRKCGPEAKLKAAMLARKVKPLLKLAEGNVAEGLDSLVESSLGGHGSQAVASSGMFPSGMVSRGGPAMMLV